MKWMLGFLLLSLTVGCAQKQQYSDFQRRNVDEFFVSSGTIKYFLPDIPAWNNFSASGKCFRTNSMRYFNLEAIRQSYNLSYEQAVQFQYTYNVDEKKLRNKNEVKFLPFKNEEELFFSTSDRIQNNFRTFKPPKFKNVNLIWIDPALADKKVSARLKNLMKSKKMDQGHPVYLTLCLERSELIKFYHDSDYSSANVKLLSYEMFSIYDVNNKRQPFYHLYLDELFDKNQKLTLFLPSKEVPPEFKGKFNIEYF